jgi:hypothetical protein
MMSRITNLLLARVGNALFDAGSTEQANLAHAVVQQLGINLVAAAFITKELVHLVERAALGLGDEERDVERAEDAHHAKENVHAERGRGDEAGGGEGDGKVVEPVGGRADRDALGTQTKREDLGDDDPRTGAPGEAEADGEDPDEDNGGPPRGAVCGPVALALGNDARDDEVADTHDDCACDECRLAAPLVDVKHGGDGGEEHDDTDDTRGEKRGRGSVQAETAEDKGCVVKDEVDTGPLLEGHDEDCDGSASEVASVREEGHVAAETEFDARGERAVLERGIVALADALLEETLGLDFEIFEFDKVGVWRETAEIGDHRPGFFIAALVDEPARGLGHEEDADSKNDGRNELNGDGEEPCCALLSVAVAADEVGSFQGCHTTCPGGSRRRREKKEPDVP